MVLFGGRRPEAGRVLGQVEVRGSEKRKEAGLDQGVEGIWIYPKWAGKAFWRC